MFIIQATRSGWQLKILQSHSLQYLWDRLPFTGDGKDMSDRMKQCLLTRLTFLGVEMMLRILKR